MHTLLREADCLFICLIHAFLFILYVYIYYHIAAGDQTTSSQLGTSSTTEASSSTEVIVISSVSNNQLSTDMNHEISDQGPSTSRNSTVVAKDTNSETSQVSHIYTMFPTVPRAALKFLCDMCNSDVQKVADCVLEGPTLEGIRSLLFGSVISDSSRTLRLDEEDYMDEQSTAEAAFAHYKSSKFDPNASLRLSIRSQPGIDTGGVRRQFFSDVFSTIATSSCFGLFEGKTNRLRPMFRQSSISSGLLKTLGTMVGHSIVLDTQGFPFLSPPCYYYIAGNVDLALSVTTKDDISDRVNYVVSVVSKSI